MDARELEETCPHRIVGRVQDADKADATWVCEHCQMTFMPEWVISGLLAEEMERVTDLMSTVLWKLHLQGMGGIPDEKNAHDCEVDGHNRDHDGFCSYCGDGIFIGQG